nr:hypothetical protein [Deltaproteobacteria bacterium]
MLIARRQRSKRELQKASEQLYYEFWMLTSVAKGLASGIAVKGWLQNALLESFIIHVRALLDFLYTDDPKSDDIAAVDYFADKEGWAIIRPMLSRSLRVARKRAGKEVAHLTYSRLSVSPENKIWSFIDITTEIQVVLSIFLEHAQADLLAPQWQPQQLQSQASSALLA